MANYTTNVSDVSKAQVMRAWTMGLLGTLGIHFFKVGRIKHGVVRLVYGLFMWMFSIGVARDPEIMAAGSGAFPAVVMFAILFIPSIVDLVRIQLGVFRDNAGNPVREK